MKEILVKEYSDGKRKIVFEEEREEASNEEYLIKKLRENGFRNTGAFALYKIFNFGVYISYWRKGIQEYKDDLTYLSDFDINLLCKNAKEVGEK